MMNTINARVAIAAGAVSLYYYLQVLKNIYNAEPAAGFMPGRLPCAAMPAFAVPAGIVIAFGCASGWLPGRLSNVQNSSI